MLVVDPRDPGVILGFGVMPRHARPSDVAEHLRCSWSVGHASYCLHHSSLTSLLDLCDLGMNLGESRGKDFEVHDH